jgi:hypothetical protein
MIYASQSLMISPSVEGMALSLAKTLMLPVTALVMSFVKTLMLPVTALVMSFVKTLMIYASGEGLSLSFAKIPMIYASGEGLSLSFAKIPMIYASQSLMISPSVEGMALSLAMISSSVHQTLMPPVSVLRKTLMIPVTAVVLFPRSLKTPCLPHLHLHQCVPVSRPRN